MDSNVVGKPGPEPAMCQIGGEAQTFNHPNKWTHPSNASLKSRLKRADGHLEHASLSHAGGALYLQTHLLTNHHKNGDGVHSMQVCLYMYIDIYIPRSENIFLIGFAEYLPAIISGFPRNVVSSEIFQQSFSRIFLSKLTMNSLNKTA